MKTIYLKAWMFLLCFTVVISSISCSKDDTSSDEIQNEEVENSSKDEDSSNENTNEEASTIETQILQLVNTHRTSIGKPVLATNSLAASLAKEHSLFMIDQGKISHDNSEARGLRLVNEENANKVGENVANKYKTAQEVMEAWLNSSGHKRNIEGDYTHIGISALKNASGHYYYTQIFLRK